VSQSEADMPLSEPRDTHSTEIIGWVGFVIIFLVWLAYWYWQAPSVADGPFDRLNTLFSGLAFWGLVFAIFLQKKELALQRYELAKTREQIEGQKEQLESQALTLRQQRFENTFFSLLDFCGSTVNSLEITINTYKYPTHRKGRDCFFEYYKEFRLEFGSVQSKHNALPLKELCDTAYSEFLRNRSLDVGHYFGTLHKVIQFVWFEEMDSKDFYIDIVRAQLTSYQLALLFYSSLSSSGSPYFKTTIELTHFFRDFPQNLLIDQSHTSLYDPSAFK
jgi:hypothetical protein